MNLTPSQQAAVDHRGSNLLVSASAGSGKTEVLARRCVSLIADRCRPCPVDRLLVVTFTRAAAAELRVRVGRMLREAADEATDSRMRRFLRKQSLLVETADIGTIDAWCGRLLRQNHTDADIDPDFITLGAEDAILLRNKVLDRVLDEIHRGEGPVAADGRAWLSRKTQPGDDFLRELVKRLSRFREELVNPDAWFARQQDTDRRNAASTILATALSAECAFQQEQLRAILASSPVGVVQTILSPYCDDLASWSEMLANNGDVRRVVDGIASFRFPRKPKGVDLPPLVMEVKERWYKRRLKETWKPATVERILCHEQDAGGLLQSLLRMEEHYREMLQSTKRARAAYEFGDVQAMALDLLGRPADGPRREPTELALRLRTQYEHILVDEYQDTSPVQVELLRLVTRDSDGQGNRFMVGDVKQSIYGFRQAEPRLFSELSDAIQDGREEGRVQYLTDNFRSHAGVLDPLNAVFAALFDRSLGGTAFGQDERLRAEREEIRNETLDASPRVVVHLIEAPDKDAAAHEDESGDDDVITLERIEREAQLAANHIREMLANGVRVPDRNEDGELILRPLRYADIVILLRAAHENAGQVARILRLGGIPCVASGRETLLDAVEVRDVCNVLSLLVNRRQDVPLVGYLRGPLVGLDECDLLTIHRACPDRYADWHDRVARYMSDGDDSTLIRKLRDAWAQLDAWATAANEQELPALLQRIMRDGALTLFARGLPGGEQRVTLLEALLNLATTFGNTGQGVAEFVEHLEALSAAKTDPGAQSAGPEDVVRIMTIHGSKGLEFPVVYLLGSGARFNDKSQREPLQHDADTGLGIKFDDYPARTTLISAEHLVGRLAVKRREIEEELRLLYVATTRARESLIIVGHTPANKWADTKEQYATAQAVPLVSRLSVSNRLEWVLQAAAMGRLHEPCPGGVSPIAIRTHSVDDFSTPEPGEVMSPQSGANATMSPADEAWCTRGWQLLSASVGDSLSTLPATVSVSAMKELALRDPDADTPHVLDRRGAPLHLPSFASHEKTPEGRVVGTALHHFMEFADLSRLATVGDIRGQVNALVTSGRMPREEAELVPVDDVAWFAKTPEGCLFAIHATDVRREMPFVYALPVDEAGERTIVRGVIDCLLDTPNGLVILDYKTDDVRDAAKLAARVETYSLQLRLYAQAATAILQRPTHRAVLAFLRGRRVIDAPLGEPLTLRGVMQGANSTAPD